MPTEIKFFRRKLNDCIFYIRLPVAGMNFSADISEVSARRWSVKWPEIKLQ
jgi:hypothetical protein